MSSRRAWLVFVAGVGLAGLAVRLLIVARSHGGADLRIYTYYSRLVLHGFNPFAPPVNPAFPNRLASDTPLEVAFFAGLLKLHDSPTTLRVCFALAQVATLLLIGLAFPRPRSWRAAFLVFYAFNPLVLVAWTAYAEDKSILFLAIAGLMLALEKGRRWTVWVLDAFLTAFKFLGAFLVPVLALHTLRQRRNLLWPLVLLVAIVGLTALLWFPDGLHAFTRRTGRTNVNPPLYASPVLLLSRLGIYSTAEPTILSALGLLATLWLFAVHRLDVREAVAFSLVAGYVFLPDDAFDRLLLITLPLLLLMHPTLRQWLVLWVVSSVAALGATVATRGVPHLLSSAGGPLRAVFGRSQGTVPHVLWMSLFFAVVLAMFISERGFLGRLWPHTAAQPA